MKLSDISASGTVTPQVKQWFAPPVNFPSWTIMLRLPNVAELSRDELTELWVGKHTMVEQDFVWDLYQNKYRVLGTIAGPGENSTENRMALINSCNSVLGLKQLQPLLKAKSLLGKTEFQPGDLLARTTRYNWHSVFVWLGDTNWEEGLVHFSIKHDKL